MTPEHGRFETNLIVCILRSKISEKAVLSKSISKISGQKTTKNYDSWCFVGEETFRFKIVFGEQNLLEIFRHIYISYILRVLIIFSSFVFCFFFPKRSQQCHRPSGPLWNQSHSIQRPKISRKLVLDWTWKFQFIKIPRVYADGVFLKKNNFHFGMVQLSTNTFHRTESRLS